MKLYVWTNYCPDYTSGLAFAIAHSELEAKQLIEKTRGFSVSYWGDLTILPLNKLVAYEVSGGG